MSHTLRILTHWNAGSLIYLGNEDTKENKNHDIIFRNWMNHILFNNNLNVNNLFDASNYPIKIFSGKDSFLQIEIISSKVVNPEQIFKKWIENYEKIFSKSENEKEEKKSLILQISE
jgi:hypothetical protein